VWNFLALALRVAQPTVLELWKLLSLNIECILKQNIASLIKLTDVCCRDVDYSQLAGRTWRLCSSTVTLISVRLVCAAAAAAVILLVDDDNELHFNLIFFVYLFLTANGEAQNTEMTFSVLCIVIEYQC